MKRTFPARLAIIGVTWGTAIALTTTGADATRSRAGTLDPRFGTGGKVITEFGGFARANAVAVQARDKVVAAGTARNDFGLVRYNRDGTPDTGFGAGGVVTTDFFGDHDEAHALVAQADGKLIAVGAAFAALAQPDFAVVRYHPDGTLDAGFGHGGKVTLDLGGHDRATSVVVQADGKLIVGGYTIGFSDISLALVRYNQDGSLDTGFGTNGTVITPGAQIPALAVQTDGKLLAAATTTGLELDFALIRYQQDGSLDTGFGIGGRVITDFTGGSADQPAALVIQDGKPVVAGSTVTADFAARDFAVARYNEDGSLDTTFGTGGKVTTDIAGHQDWGRALLIQDGKLVVGGSADTSSEFSFTDFALVRYNQDGTLDPGFGNGGKVTTDFAGSTDSIQALASLPRGQFVAAGVASAPIVPGFALARYRS